MVHTHVHSMFSLGDGMSKVEDIIDRLEDIGQDTIAITDHGNLHASVSFYKAFKKKGIKYIHGCEMYICDDTNIKDSNNRYYHLLVLCKNDVGRINLNKLVSMSDMPEKFYYKPRIDFNDLKQHSEGLVVASACLGGEVPQFLLKEDYEEAKSRALKYKELFGDDYYLEIQASMTEDQIKINKEMVELSEELEIELIVTSDAHYVYKEDYEYHSVHALAGKGNEDTDTYVGCYLQSEDEIRENIAYLDDEVVNRVIQNTHVISDKCNVELPLSEPIIPSIKLPPPFNTEKAYLVHLCDKGFEERYINQLDVELKQEYVDRYNYELEAIDEMGFIGYYLLVYDYANKIKRRGIARGSGGGSLIAYLMNIVDIDPIEHGLYFERFIDVGALELLRDGTITRRELKIPDFDLDFSAKERHIIIEYLTEEYGLEYAACIGKFGYNHARGTIKDIGKQLGLTFEETNEITKKLGDLDLKEALDLGLLDEFKEKYKERCPRLFDYVTKLSGLPKSFGLHACGRIIAMSNLSNYTATCYHESGEKYLQGDMHDVEDLGLVKVDVLGLRTIDVIYDTLNLIDKDYEYINPKLMGFHDEKVWELFKNGNTKGIFQFESRGMQNTLSGMKCSEIDELSAANALFRPGSMDYIPTYIKRKNGEEPITYLHPDLEPILKTTYGIIVFQEQLIEIGRLAGLKNPDKLRKATAKKIEYMMDEIKPELIKGLLNRGWTNEQLTTLWDDILKFAKYSFNKSHSSAYAIIAYMTARLKVYHTEEFFSSLFNSYIGESSFRKKHADDYYHDAIKNGVVFNKFDYRNDHRICNLTDDRKINYSIALIKDCSIHTAEDLYQLGKNEYDSFLELLIDMEKTSINKSQIHALIKLGFFNIFGNSKALYEFYELFRELRSSEKLESGETIKSNPKLIYKSKVDKFSIPHSIFKRYARATDTQYRDLDMDKIYCELFDYITFTNQNDFSFIEQISFHGELIGFVSLKTNKQEDRAKLIILNKKELVSKKGKHWAYSIKAMSMGSGKVSQYTIKLGWYRRHPFEELDTIMVGRNGLVPEMYNGNKYWNITHYTKIGEESLTC